MSAHFSDSTSSFVAWSPAAAGTAPARSRARASEEASGLYRSCAVTATEFKAKCLDLLDQVNSGAIARLEVTKRGKVVAVVTKPPATAGGDLHGFMRGSVIVPPDLDLTAPTGGDAPTDAELGILHR